jgi:transcriptional regulator with XRE-family HTH domain
MPDTDTVLDHYQRLATALRQQRISRGLTMRGLAEVSGVSTNNICRIESGRVRPNLTTLARLLDALGCDLAVVSPGEVEALRARVAELEQATNPVLESENRRLWTALNALARQPHLTHDLIDQARAACATTLIPLTERTAA